MSFSFSPYSPLLIIVYVENKPVKKEIQQNVNKVIGNYVEAYFL